MQIKKMYRICILISGFMCLLANNNNLVGAYTNCEQMIEYYNFIGCTPMEHSIDDKCLSNFVCPEFHKFDKEKCYFEGKYFSVGEILPVKLIANTCRDFCECIRNLDGRPVIGCKRKSETNQYRLRATCHFGGRHCFSQYKSIRDCESYRYICNPVEIAKLPKCYFEGSTYNLYQMINRHSQCYKCLCTEDFDNSTSVFENPNCRRLDPYRNDCTFGFYHFHLVIDGCAPVIDNDSCCLKNFRCPDDNELMVDPKSISTDKTDGMHCKFGEFTLRRFEKLKYKPLDGWILRNNDAICECILPPFITCFG